MMRRLRHPSDGLTSIPVHPIALAAIPVLFLFAQNAVQQVTLEPLWLPLGAAIAAAAVLVLVAAAIVRDWRRGALVASLAVVLFFSFGHVWNVVSTALELTQRRWLIGAYGVIAIVGLGIAWRGGRWVTPLTRFLNVVAVVLLAFNVVRVVDFAAGGRHDPGPSSAALHLPAAAATTRQPDIYYIILDRYASAETLDRIYGYDNTPFLRELEGRGFTIAHDSWANYLKTSLSVYSSLSMDYLDRTPLNDGTPLTFDRIHTGLRGHLPVPSTLRSLGYEYVHIGNIWEPTATNVDADRVLRYAEGSEFSSALLATTAWMLTEPLPLPDDDPDVAVRPLTRRHTLFEFDRLEEVAARPGPTYVFAHILVPHPAWVFNADGSFPSTKQLAGRSDNESYIEQLRWANGRVLEVLDKLTDVPPADQPVIIIQADEGPLPAVYEADQNGFDWLNATPDEMQQKYGILNALRLPGVDPAQAGITDRLSPVNEFRIVFNAYFDAKLPILPDTTLLSPNMSRFFDFVPYDRP